MILFTLQVAMMLLPSVVVAVILAVPSWLPAVTRPLELTVATLVLLDVQVRVWL